MWCFPFNKCFSFLKDPQAAVWLKRLPVCLQPQDKVVIWFYQSKLMMLQIIIFYIFFIDSPVYVNDIFTLVGALKQNLYCCFFVKRKKINEYFLDDLIYVLVRQTLYSIVLSTSYGFGWWEMWKLFHICEADGLLMNVCSWCSSIWRTSDHRCQFKTWDFAFVHI